MRNYRIASAIMIAHGGFMELGGCLALVPAVLLNLDTGMERYFSFIIPYFQQNMRLMMAISGIYGAVRLIGAIALWKNRMWGLALSVINCVVTMVLMVFMLPAGIVDGVLACSALILMLSGYFGGKTLPQGPAGYHGDQ